MNKPNKNTSHIYTFSPVEHNARQNVRCAIKCRIERMPVQEYAFDTQHWLCLVGDRALTKRQHMYIPI